MDPRYTEEQLNSLIADVTKEFSTHIAKAEEGLKLAKSEEPPKKDESKEKDEKKAGEESKGESEKPMESEKKEDKGVKDQDQQADDKAGKSDQKMPGDNKEGAPAAAAGGGEDDHGYDDEDLAHMHSMYSSMNRGELKAHHDAVRKCMDGMGLAKCEDGMAKAETGDAAKDAEGYRPNGGPKDGESKGESSMAKSEKDVSIEEVTLLKSELEAAKAKGDEHKKNLDAVEAFLKKFVEKTAPAGKAITSMDIIAKTEGANETKPLTKSEIDAKLLAKAKDLTLSKSDRDAINSYYFSKNIEKVSHLLK